MEEKIICVENGGKIEKGCNKVTLFQLSWVSYSCLCYMLYLYVYCALYIFARFSELCSYHSTEHLKVRSLV